MCLFICVLTSTWTKQPSGTKLSMKAKINPGKVTVNNQKYSEHDLQRIREKFYNNLKASSSEC